VTARPTARSDLLLVLATVLATLAIYRQFAVDRPHARVPRRQPPGADPPEVHQAHLQPSAESPIEIRPAGWKEILLRTYQQINEDRLLAIAAGVVFYGLLALFPAITALVSSYGLFADASTISDNLRTLAVMLPEGTFVIVQDQIARVLAKGGGTLSFTFLFGLVLAFWSANAGMKAIMDALNVVYDEEETRSFFKLNIVSLTLTIAALAAILIMAGAVIAVPLALQYIGVGEQGVMLLKFGRWPLLVLLLLFALAILYRFGPSRKAPRWQWLSVGAMTASILWLAGSSLLSWYLANFGNYNATYGALGAVIGLMMWFWMSAIIVLVGAELNSEIEHQAVVSPKDHAARRAANGVDIAEPVRLHA
jgi:membrane protein